MSQPVVTQDSDDSSDDSIPSVQVTGTSKRAGTPKQVRCSRAVYLLANGCSRCQSRGTDWIALHAVPALASPISVAMPECMHHGPVFAAMQ